MEPQNQTPAAQYLARHSRCLMITLGVLPFVLATGFLLNNQLQGWVFIPLTALFLAIFLLLKSLWHISHQKNFATTREARMLFASILILCGITCTGFIINAVLAVTL